MQEWLKQARLPSSKTMEIRFLDIRETKEEKQKLWRSWMTEERRRELEKMADPLPHLCAEALARIMLADAKGCRPEEVEIIRGVHGKPKTDGVYFSISHSKDWAVCAVADVPVGIDLECRHDVSERIMKKLNAKNSEDFLRRWTEMEARVKCLGSTVFHWREFLVDPKGYYTEPLRAPEGYAASICCKE